MDRAKWVVLAWRKAERMRDAFENKAETITFTVEEATMNKLREKLEDVNVNECPWFDVQDRHGNAARYYREDVNRAMHTSLQQMHLHHTASGGNDRQSRKKCIDHVAEVDKMDCISRQAAIDAVNKNRDPVFHDSVHYEDAVYDISKLPSAQPEPCEDAVSRHRLLSDLEELIVAWEKYPVMAEQRKGVEAAIGYVKTIPSAQPTIEERKKGKWIKEYWNGEHTRKCSACNITQTVTTYRGKVNFNFCPYCGADMRGGEDE